MPPTKTKKRILISAEYLAFTGFSTVCENICEILKYNFDITVIDYSRQHDYVFKTNGITFTGNPKSASEDRFGVEKIIRVMESYDYLFFINDIWNIDEMLTSIRMSEKKPPNIVIYFPIDAGGHFGYWYKNMDIVTSVVTYTKFAKGVISEAVRRDFGDKSQAEELISKISIIPHGVSENDFYKVDDKVSVRRELFKSDAYDNAFIVINANRNQPRKRLDITMRAFAAYLKDAKVDSYLYMHCGIIDSSIDIYNYARAIGILDRLILSVPLDKPKQKPTLSFEQLNLVYNACDVGINTSIGEGWGLCSVEQASIGVPQIVPRHSACAEIFSEREANFIDCPVEVVMDNTMIVGMLPSVESAAHQIRLMSDSEYRMEKASNSISKFSQKCYYWDGVIKDAWLSIFQ